MTNRPELAGEGEDMRVDALTTAFDQVLDARTALLRSADSHLKLPFRALASLVGGISPGDVWFVAGFSGNGKTSLLLSLSDALLRHGHCVYYMGLETQPNVLRTQFACHRLGLDSGDILSGEAKLWPNWSEVRGELLAELERQHKLGRGYELLVNGQKSIDTEGLRDALHEAALSRASLVIIDHIDHLTDSGQRSAYEESRQVVRAVLTLAQEYDLRLLVATQLNNDAVRGDRLAVYAPPQPQHVKMGGHKREIASGMLGIYRPQRTDVGREEILAVREGRAEPHTVLVPQTMGVVCMKHRNYGSREGQRIVLHISRGKVSDPVSPEHTNTAA